MTIDPKCKLCSGDGYLVSKGQNHAMATACDCIGVCEKCGGTGFISVGDEPRSRMTRCGCLELDRRIERFNNATIPNRYAHCSRSNYENSGEQLAPYMAVSGYVMDFNPGQENEGLFLYGDVGRGKTHLMVATLRELIFEHGISARFVEFSLLLGDLKASFERGKGASKLVDPLYSVDVLAIDEMGKGRGTEWEETVLDELISRRYNALKTILVTSNYAPGKATGTSVPNLAKTNRPPLSLVDRVGFRVNSRLAQMCKFVPVRGQDYRAKRR